MLAVTLALVLAMASGTTIVGRVVDSSTSFGVPYARLTFRDPVSFFTSNAYTDPSGFYSLVYVRHSLCVACSRSL
jgi:hypothetical protein